MGIMLTWPLPAPRKRLRSREIGLRLKTIRPRARLEDRLEAYHAHWQALTEARSTALAAGDRCEAARLSALLASICRQRARCRDLRAAERRRPDLAETD